MKDRERKHSSNIHFIAFIIIFLLAACGQKPPYASTFEQAKGLINSNPDSALTLLYSLQPYQDSFSKSIRMEFMLQRLNAQNKCDTIFHSDSIAKLLVDYYSHHGTRQQRMLTNYLAGRVYYDMGNLPLSLQFYQKALKDSADTEKDYYLLCRVHAQMANVYYQESLIEDQIFHINQSVRYAMLCGDTIGALINYEQKTDAFDRLGMRDSSIKVGEFAYSQFMKLNKPQYAANIMASLAADYLCEGRLEDARRCLDFYEKESGYFNEQMDIEEGREIYYYIKGQYYLKTSQLDSAEYYFRKELSLGKDFNNQNAAAKGLSQLYQYKNAADSVAKYSIYSYDMNDSIYAQMATKEVERLKALFDYSHFQEQARLSELKAERKSHLLNISLLVLGIIILFVYFIAQKERKKRKENMAQYLESLAHLNKVQEDVAILMQHEEEYKNVITSKENEISLLLDKVSQYEQPSQNDNLGKNKQRLPLFKEVNSISAKGQRLPEKLMSNLHKYAQRHYPAFYKFINTQTPALNEIELNTCVLIRLAYRPSEIATMLGCSSSYITKIRIALLHKMYNHDGSAQEFDKKIANLS